MFGLKKPRQVEQSEGSRRRKWKGVPLWAELLNEGDSDEGEMTKQTSNKRSNSALSLYPALPAVRKGSSGGVGVSVPMSP